MDKTKPKIDPMASRILAAGLRGLADDVRSGAIDARALLLANGLLPSRPAANASAPRGPRGPR